MCGARRGTLSQREKVTGRAFDRQIGSTKRGDRYADFRIRTGFSFDRHIRYATGDGKWSSGESRFNYVHADVDRATAGDQPGAGGLATGDSFDMLGLRVQVKW